MENSQKIEVGSQARKWDADKTRYDLVYDGAEETLARVYTMGAKKYGDRNYLQGDGLRWGRIYAAMRRHLQAMRRGEWLDPESGLPHLAHVAWGCFTLQEYRDKGIAENDIHPNLTTGPGAMNLTATEAAALRVAQAVQNLRETQEAA